MTRKYYELSCTAPDCDNVFESVKSNKETCSPKCHMRLQRVRQNPKTFQTCALPSCNTVINTKIKRGRPQLYCSDAHMRRHNYIYENDITPENRMSICLNPMCETPEFPMRHGGQKYCNEACRVMHAALKRKIVVEEIKRTQKKDRNLVCDYCGNGFSSSRDNTKFCATSCRVMFNKQNRMSEWVNKDMTFGADDSLYDDLEGEIFIDCIFNRFDFSGKSMTRARFIRCDFIDCNMTKCFFDGVDLIDTQFKGINDFAGSMIRFTKFPSYVKLEGAIVSKISRKQLLLDQAEKLRLKKINYYA